jgi:signal transduction histidine kinase
VLLVAKLGPGTPLDKERVELKALIAGVVELYQPVAEDAGMRLVLAPPPVPDPLYVDANPQLLGQAFANLIDNAIKYAGTPTTATASEITIELSGNDQSISVVVGDRGPGIARADRKRVLERYVRLEKSRSQPGTGLGLSLVAAVARAHGARLTLGENYPGLRVIFNMKLVPPLPVTPSWYDIPLGGKAYDEDIEDIAVFTR